MRNRKPLRSSSSAQRVARSGRPRPIPRNPASLGSLDIFAALDAPEVLTPLTSPQRIEDVIAKVRDGLTISLRNPARVHGWHVQQMFGQVTQALSAVALLKEEDQGNTWVVGGSGTRPPDFRIVLNDGTNLLVEVKNHFARRPMSPFGLRNIDLAAAQRYADLVRCRLLYAVYWARLGHWTLVDPGRFSTGRSKSTLSMDAAMRGNEMALLGDYMVWTEPPLTLVLEFDDDTSSFAATSTGRSGLVTIRGVRFEAAGRVLNGATERRLFWYLLLYGRWTETLESDFEEATLKQVRFRFGPEEAVPGQNLESIGFLSSLITNAFIIHTAADGEVTRLATDLGTLGESLEVMRNFSSDELRLVRVVLQTTPLPTEAQTGVSG